MKDKADSDSVDLTEVHSSKENKRSGDDNKKQRKQHQSPEHISHEMDKERSKKAHGHSSDRKKSRRVRRFICFTNLFMMIICFSDIVFFLFATNCIPFFFFFPFMG